MVTVFAHEICPGDMVVTEDHRIEVDFADTMPNGDIRIDGYDHSLGGLVVEYYLACDLVNILP